MLKYGLILIVIASIQNVNCMHCQKLNPDLLPEIDFERVQGIWYKMAIASSPFTLPFKSLCFQLDCTYNANDSLTAEVVMYANKTAPRIYGYKPIIEHNPNGGLTVLSSGWSTQYFAVITDYIHYAIAYTCIYALDEYIGTIVYIGGPTENFNDTNLQLAFDKLKEYDIPPQNYWINYKNDC